MITGAHIIIYSRDPDADRAFIRDVLKLTHIDAGAGWLIFGLPPSELAIHPAEKNDVHELYLLCDDIRGFTAEMAGRGVHCSDVQERDWGLLAQLTLPGGGQLGVYQPRHARPGSTSARRSRKKRIGVKKAVRTTAGGRKRSRTRRNMR
jgi:hypothetical protein